MLKKILFITFALSIAIFLWFAAFYFIQKGNELARFANEPAEIADVYAAGRLILKQSANRASGIEAMFNLWRKETILLC